MVGEESSVTVDDLSSHKKVTYAFESTSRFHILCLVVHRMIIFQMLH